MKQELLFVLLVLTGFRLAAQPISAELYRVRVVTVDGKGMRGVLYDVSESHVHLVEDDKGVQYDDRLIPLADVKRVVIRRQSPGGATITGAILGGLATGFLVVQSSRKNLFRSPVLYGLNLSLAVGAGAAGGALIGHKVGNTTRRVIRPVGREYPAATESLRRQLEPFSYSYQRGVLNRLRP